ncbi:MAG: hypothetical protein GXP54_06440 [Deltaproteobacteria bacterium]|nr:hypothetical protein [Deltaproteobacteria bacterium]
MKDKTARKTPDDPDSADKPAAKKAVTKKTPAAKAVTAKKKSAVKKKAATEKKPAATGKKPGAKKKVKTKTTATAKKKTVVKKKAATEKKSDKSEAVRPAKAKSEKTKPEKKKKSEKKQLEKEKAPKEEAEKEKLEKEKLKAKKPARKKVFKPTWRTIDDPRVKSDFEEAEGDMEDARELATRSGGAVMSAWHAGQAAEKFLRTLAAAADIEVSVMWDIRRVFEAVRGLADASEMAEVVDVIAGSGESGAAPPCANHHHRAIAAASRIRRAALRLLGGKVEGEDEPIPEPVSGGRSRSGPHDDSNRQGRPHRGRGGPPRSGRSERDRRTSFVKTFLICHNCGVRIPRTRQTARGRVPCPLCGRPMRTVR